MKSHLVTSNLKLRSFTHISSAAVFNYPVRHVFHSFICVSSIRENRIALGLLIDKNDTTANNIHVSEQNNENNTFRLTGIKSILFEYRTTLRFLICQICDYFFSSLLLLSSLMQVVLLVYGCFFFLLFCIEETKLYFE